MSHENHEQTLIYSVIEIGTNTFCLSDLESDVSSDIFELSCIAYETASMLKIITKMSNL